MIKITDHIEIADWEVSEQFVRASGPGGQNVNKVSSSVQLRFEALRSPNLTSSVKSRLRKLAGRRWTKDGALIITAEEFRSQALNRESAEKKLVGLIRQALVVPKRRIKTRPTLASKRRRLDAKNQRAKVKALRGKVDRD